MRRFDTNKLGESESVTGRGYHLVLGPGGVALYSLVSAAAARAHARTHACTVMAAEEPEEQDELAVKAISS